MKKGEIAIESELRDQQKLNEQNIAENSTAPTNTIVKNLMAQELSEMGLSKEIIGRLLNFKFDEE